LAVTIPLAFFSIQGIEMLVSLIERKRALHRPVVFIVIVFLTSLSSISLIFGNVQVLKTRPEPVFYPAGLDPAMDWLADNAKPGDFVLGTEYTGQLVAQKTGLKVYLGHEMETIGYNTKKQEVAEWYQANIPASVLEDLPVEWVVYGPYEQKEAPHFMPGANLTLVYEEAGVSIFKIK
jgi:hypothetical protein